MENNGVKYGILFGLGQIIMMMVLYFVSPKMMFSGWVGLAGFCVFYIGGMVKTVLEERKDSNGFISFKEAFKNAFIFSVIIAVLGTLFNYVLFNFIDPGLVDLQMEQTAEILANWMSGDQLEEALDNMKREDFGLSPKRALITVGGSIVFMSIIAAIVSAIMKRERPAHLQDSLDGDSLDSDNLK